MKTKRVNRYYCDYCKKSGCSSYHMRRHEEHCTMNPLRKCGVCAQEINTQPEELAVAVASLPDVEQFKTTLANEYGGGDFYSIPGDVRKQVVSDLDDRLNGCPACVFAALRQSGWAAFVTTEFDLKQRLHDWWSEVNAAREDWY